MAVIALAHILCLSTALRTPQPQQLVVFLSSILLFGF